MRRFKTWFVSLFAVGILVLSIWMLASSGEEIDYNNQIKPIINKHCISCHGGVKQSGGLSFLFEHEAKGETESGKVAIIPGKPSRSELIRRLRTDDPEERMPFEKDPLTKEEIHIFEEWIKQGAKWDIHWAYKPVQNPALPEPAVNKDQWGTNNQIDLFVHEKMVTSGLTPSSQAEVPDLARRLALDIIGLPVSRASFEKLILKPDDLGWQQFIDTLLASPHFGEKWAGMWMDLARYSDTKGYERDDARTIWKYRDWLIKAFNQDKPLDQFIIEQIAGDLLPEAHEDQFLATAFHRNTMTNDEGGTDNEEYRVAAVVDRVNTTWEVLMGTTFACVQCHSHPYDPITHQDYYQFMGYFNNTRDEDTYAEYPAFRHFNTVDSLKLDSLIQWLQINSDPERVKGITQFIKTWQPSYNSLTCDEFVNSELADTKWLVLRNDASSRLKKVSLDTKNGLIFRYKSFVSGGIWKMHLDSVNGPVVFELEFDKTNNGWNFDEISFPDISGTHDVYFTYYNPNLKDDRSNGVMFDWFYFTKPFPGNGNPGYLEAKERFWDLVKANVLQTPIMLENPPSMARETRIFDRGDWLSPKELVSNGVPAIIKTYNQLEPVQDRLGLAQWMVHEQHPLTARVFVNRVWEQLFGLGIVETLEDFGSQGMPPTHQELLDHLAWKFMHDFDWSLKQLLKYLVSSATYQQSSYSKPEQLQNDPQNRYLSRGPRIRLSAEQVRDQALVVSGLWSAKMYGPSVMPFQPDRIWNSPYNNRKWVQSEGEDQYRRALYTYWKRTSPYPSMLLFDAMAREVCASRRISTNTPLQALVTLNDRVYIEAAQAFSRRMIEEGGDQPQEQIKHGYALMMQKEIPEEKLRVLLNLYETTDQKKSQKEAANPMEVVANAMLNLDEFIMKS